MARSVVSMDTDWAEAHLGANGVVIVEVDEEADAYAVNHLPRAVGSDRAFVDKDGFKGLVSREGIANDCTVVLYGGNNNWLAVLLDGAPTIANCCIGHLSTHSRFVLNELLDEPNGKDSDGSRVEYGSVVGVPVEG